MRVLFLCTGNSCRSIFGEAIFNHLAPSGWCAMSAGSKPTGHVHPRSLALLEREGISTVGYYSKSWENLPATPDIVITVCANAEGETCPAYLGLALRTNWGVEDPARATGTDAEVDDAFVKSYRIMRARIESFFDLPLGTLQHDKVRGEAEARNTSYRHHFDKEARRANPPWDTVLPPVKDQVATFEGQWMDGQQAYRDELQKLLKVHYAEALCVTGVPIGILVRDFGWRGGTLAMARLMAGVPSGKNIY